MNLGAYCLARFTDPERLIPVATSLAQSDSIAHWDAVDGHVQLVFRTKGSAQLPADLVGTDGIDELMRYEIVDDGEVGEPYSPELSHAYLFIETEPSKRDSVRALLTATEGILWSSVTKGGCDIVAVVKGKNFDAVERIVGQKIRMLDGVLRLKHDRIIDLRQL